jgi:hypothetical protein
MNPWLAAYLGAHITATIAVLTTWNYYLTTSKLHPTRSGRTFWMFVAVVLTPVFLVATIGFLWALNLFFEIWDKGVKNGFRANRNEMRRAMRL